MIRLRRMFGFCTALLAACVLVSPIHAQWNREKEEDAVYRAALAHTFKGDSSFVLVDSVPSSTQKEPIRDSRGAPISAPDRLLAELAADYKATNERRRSIRSFATTNGFTLVSDSALATMSAPNGASPANSLSIRRAFPNAGYLVRMSRPGFSADHRSAILYMGSNCGIRCGSFGVMVLVKDGDVWRFDRYLWEFVS